jgi:hypothetical protein
MPKTNNSKNTKARVHPYQVHDLTGDSDNEENYVPPTPPTPTEVYPHDEEDMLFPYNPDADFGGDNGVMTQDPDPFDDDDNSEPETLADIARKVEPKATRPWCINDEGSSPGANFYPTIKRKLHNNDVLNQLLTRHDAGNYVDRHQVSVTSTAECGGGEIHTNTMFGDYIQVICTKDGKTPKYVKFLGAASNNNRVPRIIFPHFPKISNDDCPLMPLDFFFFVMAGPLHFRKIAGRFPYPLNKHKDASITPSGDFIKTYMGGFCETTVLTNGEYLQSAGLPPLVITSPKLKTSPFVPEFDSTFFGDTQGTLFHYPIMITSYNYEGAVQFFNAADALIIEHVLERLLVNEMLADN